MSLLRVAAPPVSVSTISLRPNKNRLHADKLTQLPTIIHAFLRYIHVRLNTYIFSSAHILYIFS